VSLEGKWGCSRLAGRALSVLFGARKEEDAMQVLRFGLVCLVAK